MKLNILSVVIIILIQSLTFSQQNLQEDLIELSTEVHKAIKYNNIDSLLSYSYRNSGIECINDKKIATIKSNKNSFNQIKKEIEINNIDRSKLRVDNIFISIDIKSNNKKSIDLGCEKDFIIGDLNIILIEKNSNNYYTIILQNIFYFKGKIYFTYIDGKEGIINTIQKYFSSEENSQNKKTIKDALEKIEDL